MALNFGLSLWTLDLTLLLQTLGLGFDFWNPGLCIADFIFVGIVTSLFALWGQIGTSSWNWRIQTEGNCKLGWSFTGTIDGLVGAVFVVQLMDSTLPE